MTRGARVGRSLGSTDIGLLVGGAGRHNPGQLRVGTAARQDGRAARDAATAAGQTPDSETGLTGAV